MYKSFTTILLVIALAGCSASSNEERANEKYVAASSAARSMESEAGSHTRKYELYKDARQNIDEIIDDFPSTNTAVALTSRDIKITGRTLDEFINLDRRLARLAEFEQSPLALWTKFICQNAPKDEIPGAVSGIVQTNMKWGSEQQAELMYKTISEASMTIEDQFSRDKLVFQLSVLYAQNFTSPISLERLQIAEGIAQKHGGLTYGKEFAWATPEIATAYFKNEQREKATSLLNIYIEGVKTNEAESDDIASGMFRAARAFGDYDQTKATSLAKESFQISINNDPGLSAHMNMIKLIEFYSEIDEVEVAIKMAKKGLAWARGTPENAIRQIGVLTDYSQLFEKLGSKNIAEKILSDIGDVSVEDIGVYNSTDIAEAYVGLNRYIAAHKYTEAITYYGGKENPNDALTTIGVSQARSGFIKEAIQTADKISDDFDKSTVLFWVSKEYATEGRLVTALESARAITNGRLYRLAWLHSIEEYMKSQTTSDFKFTALAYDTYEHLEDRAKEELN